MYKYRQILSWGDPVELYINYPETEKMLISMQNTDFSYYAHLHNCLEFSFCTAGSVRVTVDGETVELVEKQGVVIPPNSIHSYETPEHSKFGTILVGLDVLQDFSDLLIYKRPQRLTFPVDELCQKLYEDFLFAEQSYFAVKALLYRVCNVFMRGNELRVREHTNNPCVKIMKYIRDHFRQEVTLEDVAEATGYSYHYISRMVGKNFGIPFTQLLAQYRIAYACNLLNKQAHTISQVAMDAGFGSIRSFNRIFREIMHMAPEDYIKQNNDKQIK